MIVELDIKTYIGASMGAKHYYADLKWTRPEKKSEKFYSTYMSESVYGITSKDDAAYINKLGWEKEKVKAGDTCFGWIKREDAIKNGVDKFIETFDTKKDILVMYPGGSVGVCVVMVGPDSLKEKIKPWSDACEALDWDWDKHAKKMDEIDREFDKFWNEYKKKHRPRNVKYDQWSFKGKDLIGD